MTKERQASSRLWLSSDRPSGNDLPPRIAYRSADRAENGVSVQRASEPATQRDEVGAMKICVCGSMSFVREMVAVGAELEQQGHSVILPDRSEAYDDEPVLGAPVISSELTAQRKIEHDFIRKHYEAIARADAVLVLNYTKCDVVGYVGANSFLEMGFAHVLHKPIYLVEPLNASQTAYYPEMLAMQPVNIGADWTKLMDVGR
jgi:diphthamide synthase subunit DPH2